MKDVAKSTILMGIALSLWLVAPLLVWAQPGPLTVGLPVASDLPANASAPFTPSEEFQDLITDIVRDNIPHEYEKTKNWGNTKKVFAGWQIEREGLKIETRRKWKDANDGTWQRYKLTLVDPNERFDVRLENFRELGDGKVGLEIATIARLHVFGRTTHWENGVQIYSFCVEADVDLRLRAETVITLGLIPKFPPEVMAKPEIRQAEIDITRFKIQRISAFDGPVVRSLSSTVREVVEDKIADNRQKLIDKLNASIAKKQDKLKFSLADVMKSPWGEAVGKQWTLPVTGKTAGPVRTDEAKGKPTATLK